MQQDRADALVSGIYDAALDGGRWSDVVVYIARATGSKFATLQVFDAQEGLRPSVAPEVYPDYRRAYQEHWGRQFGLGRRISHLPAGRIFRSDDLFDFDWFRSLAVYDEWWRPQAIQWPSCNCKLIDDGICSVLLGLHKPAGKDHFSSDEVQLFEMLVGHVARSMTIYRRLRIGEAGAAVAGFDAVPAGCVLVDRGMRVLACAEATRAQLFAAGLVVASGAVDRIESPGGAIEHLVAAAAGAGHRARGGDYRHIAADGGQLRVTVIPCGERDRARADWLIVDRPAALLVVEAPAERARARIERLVEAHGLTRAEAAVAIEIARGDGRAAAGERLGIRETTVRAHLSAIFDKLGLHRQAELAALVGGDGHGAAGTG